jgi:hypothetical protein
LHGEHAPSENENQVWSQVCASAFLKAHATRKAAHHHDLRQARGISSRVARASSFSSKLIVSTSKSFWALTVQAGPRLNAKFVTHAEGKRPPNGVAGNGGGGGGGAGQALLCTEVCCPPVFGEEHAVQHERAPLPHGSELGSGQLPEAPFGQNVHEPPVN